MTVDEKVNILMVDDQPAKLLSYQVILAELGENLIQATSAREALNVLLKTDVAVVLMDVSMPDMDGFELADIIRQHPRFQKTAIIFISGVHLSDSDRIQGYHSGAVDYISVPVVPEVLRAKIGIFVELRRNRRMLEALNRDLEYRVQERTEELRKSEAQFRMRAELRGFPVELRQVFFNLIGNAIQAMPEGGTLGVSVREAKDWTRGQNRIVISIFDTGRGTHPEDARRLFEPFFTIKSIKGTGLGLWISKGIVQKYEGRISFRSYRHSGGCTTCFRVFLPGSCTPNSAMGNGADRLAEDYAMSKSVHNAQMIHSVEKG